MDYTRLGKTGMQVSRLCLGCMTYGTPTWRDWILDEDASRPFYQRAIEAGINFFDTANMYSLGVSEEILGRAIREYTRRDEVVIATKVFFPMNDQPNQGGLSRKHIMQAIDDSLRRLNMDYVDLYQIHRWDYNTPIEETLEALHDVVKAGKARYIGASSMWAYQFAKALYIADQHGWTRFASMQNHYNLVYREEEREMIPLCVEEGVGLIPWSPLARGFLAGNRTRDRRGETLRSQTDTLAHNFYQDDNDFDVLDQVTALAAQHGVKPVQIALAWMLHKPGITAPIIGASKMPHLEDALGALDLTLSAAEIAQLETPYRPHTISGHS
ncbi:MAG: aldo/keto reductase [Chloroflexi bacterium]|nr:aldo/keto reductase [Chloroflexota bacterium]